MNTLHIALNLMVTLLIELYLMDTGTLALNLMNITTGVLIKRDCPPQYVEVYSEVIHFYVPITH